ncbi:hypothetical protein FHX37_4195 [Haloactinospora alba]|uniref:Uncharacterized protein n=1 Tax=Haloactinospora alba TaxID=405555 RepID=A0A543N6M3_9ACTN|nr:hypothetical protein [Haloactinospora alba]TQN26101.1 hypothetical protein FHX37_4639 [Haloactinospora alba]TQN27475.1 hypothetical protein FHX37_4195 [Haloactinospora alba]
MDQPLFSEWECSQITGQTDIWDAIETTEEEKIVPPELPNDGSLFGLRVTSHPQGGALFGVEVDG